MFLTNLALSTWTEVNINTILQMTWDQKLIFNTFINKKVSYHKPNIDHCLPCLYTYDVKSAPLVRKLSQSCRVIFPTQEAVYVNFSRKLLFWLFGHHMNAALYFFMSKTWSPFTAIVWEMTATPFSSETPAVFCGLKNFTWNSICMRVSRKWLNFDFGVNYPFKYNAVAKMPQYECRKLTVCMQNTN